MTNQPAQCEQCGRVEDNLWLCSGECAKYLCTLCGIEDECELSF